MKTVPDLNRIGSIISSWHRGVVTTKEAIERIEWAMDPANHLPASELTGLPEADESARQALAIIERIEKKVDLFIEGMPLPDEMNPAILSAAAKDLAEKGEKIAAVALHRRKTRAGLAETCKLINEHLRKTRLRGCA